MIRKNYMEFEYSRIDAWADGRSFETTSDPDSTGLRPADRHAR
ncbi:hypothetical protein [Luteibacter jiangsuensis]